MLGAAKPEDADFAMLLKDNFEVVEATISNDVCCSSGTALS
jgi:hypothetical protein